MTERRLAKIALRVSILTLVVSTGISGFALYQANRANELLAQQYVPFFQLQIEQGEVAGTESPISILILRHDEVQISNPRASSFVVLASFVEPVDDSAPAADHVHRAVIVIRGLWIKSPAQEGEVARWVAKGVDPLGVIREAVQTTTRFWGTQGDLALFMLTEIRYQDTFGIAKTRYVRISLGGGSEQTSSDVFKACIDFQQALQDSGAEVDLRSSSVEGVDWDDVILLGHTPHENELRAVGRTACRVSVPSET